MNNVTIYIYIVLYMILNIELCRKNLHVLFIPFKLVKYNLKRCNFISLKRIQLENETDGAFSVCDKVNSLNVYNHY